MRILKSEKGVVGCIAGECSGNHTPARQFPCVVVSLDEKVQGALQFVAASLCFRWYQHHLPSGFTLARSCNFCLGLAPLMMAPMQPVGTQIAGLEAMRASTLLARTNKSLSSSRSSPRTSRMASGILRRNISLKTILFLRSFASSSRNIFAAMMAADPSPMGGKSRNLDASCVSDGPKVSMTRLVKRS